MLTRSQWDLLLIPRGRVMAALSSLRGFVFSGAALGGTRVTLGSRAGGGLLILNRVTAGNHEPCRAAGRFGDRSAQERELQLVTPRSP
jgi:hypothetical protein